MILLIIGKYDEQFIQFRELSSWDYKAVSLFVSMRDDTARISWTGTFFRVSLRILSPQPGGKAVSNFCKQLGDFFTGCQVPWRSLDFFDRICSR